MLKPTFALPSVVCVLLLAGNILAQQTFSTRIARGFRQPVFGTAPAGSEDQLFVIEKASGQIRVLDLATNEIQSTPFLEVSGLATQSEAGLLGLAFHPDYYDNGLLYVYASRPGGRGNHQTNILEYTVDDPRTSTVADPASERLVMQFDQPFGNHNAGWIGFDPTATGDDRNLLYITSGDGGSGGDPQNNSQDIENNLLGKVLRIDVSGDDLPADANNNYAIPPTNPFVNTAADNEIFAYGLRNPWRASFDRDTGDFWIGDVGQSTQEEIDLIPAGSAGGQNFGWRVMEGTSCFNRRDETPCNDPSLTEPVLSYQHGSGPMQGRSVTGGYVYRGSLREFEGYYMFSDYVSDNVWTMDPYSGRFANQNLAIEADRGSANSSIASFAEDAEGNLYLIGLNSGSVFQLGSNSRDAVWSGELPDGAIAGDAEWNDANNWIRDGEAGMGFVEGDHLMVGGVSLQSDSDRRVSALTFDSDAAVSVMGELNVVSGNIFVGEGAVGTVDAELTSETAVLRKFGEGQLELRGDSDRNLVLVDGTLRVRDVTPLIVWQAGGRYEVEASDGEADRGMAQLNISGGTLALTTSETDATSLEDAAVISVSRELQLAGVLEANLHDGFEMPFGGVIERVPLIHFSGHTINGEFDEFRFGESAVGHQGDGAFVTISWETVADDDVLFMDVYQAVPGDADGNGVVEFEDFLLVAENFNMPGDWTMGDFTGDGQVNFTDFIVTSNNFGSSATVASGVASIPEPQSQLYGWLAVIGLAFYRRRVERRRIDRC